MNRLTQLILGMCLGGAIAVSPAAAQGRAPTPPTRPALPALPAPSTPPAPAQTTRPVVPSDAADLDPDHPPLLPAAPRSKMHSCGREWQDMKRRGLDRDLTWRQFATACLQRD